MPDVTSQHFRSDKDIAPGDLVWPAQVNGGSGTQNTTLWKDQGGSMIVGRLRWDRVGLVLARVTDGRPFADEKTGDDLGDQCLVLTGDMQLGWNTTHSFEKIQG